MNATDSALTYLDQSGRAWVAGNSTLANVLNYPYRLGLAFAGATRLEYQQALRNKMFYPGFHSLMETVGYFFSGYAVACFAVALVLNRVVIMSSLRSSTRTVRLPAWSRVLLHLAAVGPLLHSLAQCVAQVRRMHQGSVEDRSGFLQALFLVFAWSHCVETFVAVTTNTRPLEESDYTIFELSIQFYVMGRHSTNNMFLLEYIPDCVAAVLGRLLIHTVELFGVRQYRLLGSTVLNAGQLAYLGRQVWEHGLLSLPITTFSRHMPKVVSLVVVALSALFYAAACLVRKDPLGRSGRSTSELQYHSFMNNWWEQLNCTGEQEFPVVICKLALLLSKGTEALHSGVHKEFSALSVPASLHESFRISGYTRELRTMPRQCQSEQLRGAPAAGGSANAGGRLRAPRWLRRLQTTRELLGALVGLFRWSNARRMLGLAPASRPAETPVLARDGHAAHDLHDYITERNYARFLGAEATKRGQELLLLLPEEDYSGDYVPAAAWDSETDAGEEAGEEEDDEDEDGASVGSISLRDELREDLADLVAPLSADSAGEADVVANMGWFMSVWSILQHSVAHKGRVTRSQYGLMNPGGILGEVVRERAGHRRADKGAGAEQDERAEDVELACVVCKMNRRDVVLWPCRCLAICDDCRTSLGMRGFHSCVCCRSDVDGYSKLHAV